MSGFGRKIRTVLKAVITAAAVPAFLVVAGGVAPAQEAGHGRHGDHGGPGDHVDHGAHERGAPMEMGHGGIRFYMHESAAGADDAGPLEPERAAYRVPDDITLVDQDGRPVRLAALLAEPRPVVMQFIFTSCATICPVLSAGIASAQDELLRRAPDALILSISIDPTYDTPARLKAYAARYHASGNWRFLTGPEPMIRRTIAAFDALLRSDNKMYHRPYTYFRDRAGNWVRFDRLLSRQRMIAAFAGMLETGSSHATAGGGR